MKVHKEVAPRSPVFQAFWPPNGQVGCVVPEKKPILHLALHLSRVDVVMANVTLIEKHKNCGWPHLGKSSVSNLPQVFYMGPATIYRIVQWFDTSGGVARKTRSGVSNMIRTDDFVRQLMNEIVGDPSKSIWGHANDLLVDVWTIRKAVRDDQDMKSNAEPVRQTLDYWCMWQSFRQICGTSSELVLSFPDEKNFVQDKHMNSHNSQVIAVNPSERDQHVAYCINNHPKRWCLLLFDQIYHKCLSQSSTPVRDSQQFIMLPFSRKRIHEKLPFSWIMQLSKVQNFSRLSLHFPQDGWGH